MTTAQDGDFWIIGYKGHIRVPGIGAGFLGVQVQDGGTLLCRAHGRVGHLITEAAGKCFVLGVA